MATQSFEEKITDEAIMQKTGRPWTEWFSILDDFDCKKHGHKQSAAFLQKECGASGWWAQTITVRYEQARGLRRVGQRSDGKFGFSFRRTLDVEAQSIYEAFVDENLFSAWYGAAVEISLSEKGYFKLATGERGDIRIWKPERRLKLKWRQAEDSQAADLEIRTEPKNEEQSRLTIDFTKIAEEGEYHALRDFWEKALKRLEQHLANKNKGSEK